MEHALGMQEERLRALTENDDSAVVYEYAYDAPQEKTPAAEQTVLLARRAVAARQSRRSVKDDAEARRSLRAAEPDFEDFAKSNPKTWEMMTELERGPEHYHVLEKLARLRLAADAQGVGEAAATAEANTMLQTHCARGPAAGA